MNFLYGDFQNYLEQMKVLMNGRPPKVNVGIAVPYIYLKEAADKVGSSVKILAQDLHPADHGAFTSQISASQVASMHVPATLIGHSECRALSQSSIIISNKIRAALDVGLEVVYCCGKSPIEEVTDELKSLKEDEWKRLIIAYEPISAIGSGEAMGVGEASDVLGKIKVHITNLWGSEAANSVRYLYGGSVNPKNYKNYLQDRNIDGVLVGGASLKIGEF